jgi:uncharacterized membrane protein YfcA
MDYELLAIAALAFFFAGIVKGSVSIGLPTAAIGVLAMVIDPRLAIALIPFPILVANVRQMWSAGRVWETFKKYLPYIVFLTAFLLISSRFVPTLPDNFLLMAVGIVIVVFCIVSLLNRVPKLPDRFDTIGQIIAGIVSGIFGGLTSLWGPPMLFYLLARRTEKEDFIRATGVILFIGSFPLIFSFWINGMMNDGVWLMSAAMIVPTLLGFSVGEYLRNKMNADRFRKAVLFVFLVVGLNLLRKGLFG